MKWRYQPVWFDEPTAQASQAFKLCEVYFDDDDRLTAWTDLDDEHSDKSPVGNDLADLSASVAHMLVDTYRWKPVAYSSLEVGMTFERAISPSQAEALAKMVEAMAHNCRQAHG